MSETTFCPHGISHQPGEPDEEGRSEWCAECFPLDIHEVARAAIKDYGNAVETIQRLQNRWGDLAKAVANDGTADGPASFRGAAWRVLGAQLNEGDSA